MMKEFDILPLLSSPLLFLLFRYFCLIVIVSIIVSTMQRQRRVTKGVIKKISLGYEGEAFKFDQLPFSVDFVAVSAKTSAVSPIAEFIHHQF